MLNRCRDAVRLRIRNGQITERALALRAGISQPHLHNVLKGARPMSAELADRLMRQLGMTITDFTEFGPRPPGSATAVPSGSSPRHPGGAAGDRIASR